MQDKAIIEIGKLQLQEMGNKQPYEFFIQNMFPNKDNYDMIVVVFEIIAISEHLTCSFKEVDIQNVSEKNFEKYAYRKGSSRGGDVTFTTKFGDIEKKLKTLVENQFKSLIAKLSKSTLVNEFLIFNIIYYYLLDKQNYEVIKNELLKIYSSLSKDKQQTSGLSISILINEEEKFLADFKIIQEILYSSGTEEKSEKYDVKSEGKDQQCSVCLEQKPVLHGFASPYKYATVDKPGMVSGFFKQANNWQNYPICSDCSLAFEVGKNFISTHLGNYFYGKAYYIIPKTILSKDSENLDRAIRKLKELYKNLLEDGQKIKRQEEKFGEMVAQEKDYFNLNFLFYEENPTTKAIKIKLMLEEIVPSRFRKLFVDAPEKINKHPLYKDAITIKKEKFNLMFSFGILKTFFEEDFYDLIQKVFMLQRISEEALYGKFMQVIRANYNKMQTSDGYVEMTYLTILKAHLTLRYFKELNLVETKPNIIKMETIKESTEQKSAFDLEKLENFVKENESFFDEKYKVGIFSVGILVRLLLSIQNVNLGNTPFEKKLKGYNLNPDLLKNVYMEALQKISQYQSFYAYSNLREYINEYYILKTNEINKISNNELSFYFVAGLEFGNQFKTKEEQKS